MSVELRQKVGDKYHFDQPLIREISVKMQERENGHVHSRSGEYMFVHCNRCGGLVVGHKAVNNTCVGEVLDT
jgi:hypothetical protein